MNMNAPLSTPTSSGGRPVVVGGDLLAELLDPGVEHVRSDDGRAELRIQHGRHRTVPSSERARARPSSRCSRPCERRTRAVHRDSCGRDALAPHHGEDTLDVAGRRGRRRRATARTRPARDGHRGAQRSTRVDGAVGSGLRQRAVTQLVEQVGSRRAAGRPGGRAPGRGRARTLAAASAAPRGGSTPGASGRRRSSGPRRRQLADAATQHAASAPAEPEQRPHERRRDAAPCPASPPRPTPRSTFSSTVSAWSSAVCATRIAVAPSSSRGTLQRGVPRVAGAGLEVRAGHRPRRAPTRHATPSASAARRTTSASAALPARSPWSTCTATGASPPRPRARGARRSRRRRSTHDHDRCVRPRKSADASRRPGVGHGAVRATAPAVAADGVDADALSQVAGRVELGERRQVLGPAPRRVDGARARASRSTACDERLAHLVLAHLRSRARAALCSSAVDARASAARLRARAPCAPGRRRARAPSSFITALPWPSSSDISACTSVQRAALLVGWRRAPTRPPSSSGLRPARTRRRRGRSPRTSCRGSGSIDADELCDQREEVLAHPRHAGELGAVRDLVDRDPQPEVARAGTRSASRAPSTLAPT